MIKLDELECAILHTIICNSRKRINIYSKIDTPDNYFHSKESLEIYKTVKDIEQEGGVIDPEIVKLKSTVSSDLIKYIIDNFSDICDRNLDNLLKQAKLNTLEAKVLQKIQYDITPSFIDDSKTSEDKLHSLIEFTDSLKQVMSSFYKGPDTISTLVDKQRQELKKREIESAFKPTGDYRLDEILTYGWAPKEITFIAGRPSNGKSLMGLHYAKLLGNMKVPTIIYNFEMRNESSMDRLISMVGGINLHKITKAYNKTNDAEKKAIENTLNHISSNMTLSMYDQKTLSLDEMVASIEKEQEKIGQEYMVVAVDLLTKLTDFQKVDTAYGIEKICQRVQIAVKSLGIHLLALVQINRDADRATLNDLEDLPKVFPKFDQIKNSGAFEEIADNVLLVCSPSKYAHRYEWGEGLPSYFRVEVGKQRSGIDTGFANSLIYLVDEGVLTMQIPPADFNPLLAFEGN